MRFRVQRADMKGAKCRGQLVELFADDFNESQALEEDALAYLSAPGLRGLVERWAPTLCFR